MDKKFSEENNFKRAEFEKSHKSLNEMVQWLQVWEKYQESTKRQSDTSEKSNNKRTR